MDQEKIILFDGVCNLCNSSVQFIIERDTENKFKFASLQSEFGQEFLQSHNFPTSEFESIILLDNNKFYTKSDAALKIGKELKGMKFISSALWIFPKFIRDFFYSIIAKNRYKWFGKKDNCWLPTPELKQKFLD